MKSLLGLTQEELDEQWKKVRELVESQGEDFDDLLYRAAKNLSKWTKTKMNTLTFQDLAEANKWRLPLLKGENTDSPDYWLERIEKKVVELRAARNQRNVLESWKTTADIVIYLDIYLRKSLGRELGEAVRERFDMVSKRLGLKRAIAHECDSCHLFPTSPCKDDFL